jgi:hypothetical protein
LDFKVSNSMSGSLTSERTLNSVANELESKGLKLLVKVTPVLPSRVNTELAAADATPTAATTKPSVKHDIAVK